MCEADSVDSTASNWFQMPLASSGQTAATFDPSQIASVSMTEFRKSAYKSAWST